MKRRNALGLLVGTPLALAGTDSAPAQAATASATGNGVAYLSPSTTGNDTSAINNALAANPVVFLLPGTYTISAPIQFTQSGQLLCGFQGATQAGGGSPGVNTVIQAAATFTAPAVSGLKPGAGNPAGMVMNSTFARCEVRDLWLSAKGVNATVGATSVPLDCVTVWRRSDAFALRGVGCNNATGYALNVQNVTTTGTDPEGLFVEDCLAQNCSLGGILANSTDISMANTHAQYNGINGLNTQHQTMPNATGITISAGNARLVQCRSDLSTGYGFSVGTYNGSDDIGVGVTMIGCGTESNQLAGVHVAGNGTVTYGPVQMVGCWFQGDGSQSLAAVELRGRVVATLTDVIISTGGSGAWPAYSVQTLKNADNAVPDLVTIVGGVWEAATDFISDVLDTSPTSPRTPHQLTGTRGVLGPLPSGLTGTTKYVPVTWP